MVRTPEQGKKYYMLHINMMDQTSTSTHFSHWLCYYCHANEGSAANCGIINVCGKRRSADSLRGGGEVSMFPEDAVGEKSQHLNANASVILVPMCPATNASPVAMMDDSNSDVTAWTQMEPRWDECVSDPE